jgi:hypothetical protein
VNQLVCRNNGLVLFSWGFSESNPVGGQRQPNSFRPGRP